MTALKLQRSRLSNRDLDFVVQAAAPEFKDKAKLKQLIREDADFRKGLVGDEKVFRRVMADEEIILRISPAFYFEVLLRKALKELLRIFPEYAQFDYRYPFSGEVRPKIAGKVRRGIEDYEEEGRKFYRLAAEHQSARALELSEVFWLLHGNFNTARKPMNFISEHYLHYKKHKLFGMEAQ